MEIIKEGNLDITENVKKKNLYEFFLKKELIDDEFFDECEKILFPKYFFTKCRTEFIFSLFIPP